MNFQTINLQLKNAIIGIRETDLLAAILKKIQLKNPTAEIKDTDLLAILENIEFDGEDFDGEDDENDIEDDSKCDNEDDGDI